MGLSNKKANSQTFVTIVGGKFTIRLQDGDNNPDAVERVLGDKSPNAGKTIRELQFTHLDGWITGGLMNSESQYPSFDIYMEDGGENFTLQISMDSGYFGEVTKRVASLDPTKKVVFGLGFDKEARQGKGKHFLFIQQDGQSVHMNHTKDNPNGMPPPVEKTVKGKTAWDFEAQENFLYDVAIDWLASLDSTEKPPAYTDEQPPAEPELPEADEEQIPF